MPRPLCIPDEASQPYGDTILPSAAARAGMVLGFDTNGAPTVAPNSLTLIDTVTGLPVTITIANGALVYA